MPHFGLHCSRMSPHFKTVHKVIESAHHMFLSPLCVLQAICTEAGLMALRERRMKVTNEDFKKSKENVLYKKQEGTPEGLYL